jgi:signal transduction histidine kinase
VLELFVGYGFVAAAIIASALADGKSGIVALFRRLLVWRVRWVWYAVALFGPAAFYLAGIGIHAWLSLPLHYQGQLIGSLNLGRGAGHSFSTTDAEIAHDIANQLAIAIQQNRLYEALQNELTERQHLIAQLEAKNAELERFTYTVSHDLRNPLVTIKGFLGMLDKDIRENRQDRIQSDFQRIANAADKMQALLSDLLELSRVGRIINPPEEIDSLH